MKKQHTFVIRLYEFNRQSGKICVAKHGGMMVVVDVDGVVQWVQCPMEKVFSKSAATRVFTKGLASQTQMEYNFNQVVMHGVNTLPFVPEIAQMIQQSTKSFELAVHQKQEFEQELKSRSSEHGRAY